jgi:hypothetical protein
LKIEQRTYNYPEIVNMLKLSTTGLIMLAVMLTSVLAICPPRKRETGKLILTEEQHGDLFCENAIGLEVERLEPGAHEYRAIRPIFNDQTIIPPKVDCWALFNQYLQTNKPLFQAWANKYCRDYLSCWCCEGGGLCVTFVVKPNSPPCLKLAEPAYQKFLAVFEA